MADLTDIEGSLPVKITGAGLSGVETNVVNATPLGSLYVDINEWFGSIAPTVGTKTAANSIPVTMASDQILDVNVSTTTINPTYSAVASAFVCSAAATDVFTITGSATKTIKIIRIGISGTTTAGSGLSISFIVVKRSTANTLGVSITDTNVPFDSNNAAATAIVKHYTVNPVLGTAVGGVVGRRLTINTVGALNDPFIFEFSNGGEQPITLRGITESLCINFSGATITGPLITATVEWIEI